MARLIYRFGEYAVDPAARELRFRDVPVALPLKAFDCLAYLIENRHRAIGHDEMISAVWGEVSINGTLLRQAILQIRRAITETEAGRDVVRTITSFGYSWGVEVLVEEHVAAPPLVYHDVAAVSDVAPASEQASVDATAPSSVEPTSRGAAQFKWSKWLSVLGVLLLPMVIWNQLRPVSAPEATDPRAAESQCAEGDQLLDVVAVLPVDARVGDDEEMAWVRLGLMESIASRLSKGGQRVVPSEDIIALNRAAEGEDLRNIIRGAVCARYLVASRVQRSGGEWVVHMTVSDIDGTEHEIETNHGNLVAAARNASDHLLVMLGHPTSAENTDPALLRTDELLARIRIALWTNEFDTAAQLIESAPAWIKDNNELHWSMLDLAFRRGEFEESRKGLERLQIALAADGSPLERARVFIALGLIDTRLSRSGDALVHLDSAIDLMRSVPVPNQNGIGNAYNNRGLANYGLGNYEEASADFAQARLAFTADGHTRALSMVDANEAMVLLGRHRPAEAVALLEQSARRAERFHNWQSLAQTTGLLAYAQLSLLQPVLALSAFDRSDPRLNQINLSWVRCDYEHYRTRALIASGRLVDARRHIDAVLSSSIEYCREENLIHVEVARLDLLTGNVEQSLTYARGAVDFMGSPGLARERAEAWLIVTRALRALRRPSEEIGAENERFSAWAEQLNDPVAVVHARLAEAEQATHEEHHDRAKALYEAAMQLALNQGVPADVSMVASSYGHAVLANGDVGHGQRIASRVAQWADHDFDSAVLLTAVYQALGQRGRWQEHLLLAQDLAGERLIPPGIGRDPGADVPPATD